MSAVTAPPAPEPPAAHRDTIGEYARRWWTDVKGGELGSLPIIVGLVLIAIIFQTQNDRFLTAGNFVNVLLQTAPYAVIAMGVTFALLLGEIDLSIGFVSGVGGVLTAILLTPDGNQLPTGIALIIVLGADASIAAATDDGVEVRPAGLSIRAGGGFTPYSPAGSTGIVERVAQLQRSAPAIAGRVQAGRLKVVGATYEPAHGLIMLDTGNPSSAPQTSLEPQIAATPQD